MNLASLAMEHQLIQKLNIQSLNHHSLNIQTIHGPPARCNPSLNAACVVKARRPIAGVAGCSMRYSNVAPPRGTWWKKPLICKASVSERNTALPWSIWVLWLWYVMVIHRTVGSLIMRYKGYRNSLYEGITIPQSNPTFGCRWYVCPLVYPYWYPIEPQSLLVKSASWLTSSSKPDGSDAWRVPWQILKDIDLGGKWKSA